MTFNELQSLLSINNGQLTTSTLSISKANLEDKGFLHKGLNDMYHLVYHDLAIDINSATLVSLDAANRKVVISGTSNAAFQKKADLTLEATFQIKNGNLETYFQYTLIGEQAVPASGGGWHFGQSFPDMPLVSDYSKLFYTGDDDDREFFYNAVNPLGDLVLFKSNFVVVSQETDFTDYDISQQLKTGCINFVSKLKLEGYLSIIASVFGRDLSHVNLVGTITRPAPSQKISTLKNQYKRVGNAVWKYPWENPQLPGILLKAELDIDYSFLKDKLHLGADALYFYTPIDEDWILATTNPVLIPIRALDGHLTFNKRKGIKVEVITELPIGGGQIKILTKNKGLSIENIGDMVGLTASEKSIFSTLPPFFKEKAEEIGSIELKNVLVIAGYAQSKLTFDLVSFVFGATLPPWKPFNDDLFELDVNTAAINIGFPLDTDNRTITTIVEGEMKVENVPFTVRVSNEMGAFGIAAELEEAQTIPINTFTEKYLDGLEIPESLSPSIDSLGIRIVPNRQYSFSMGMADDPKPWVIPIGVTDISLSNMFLYVAKQPGSSVDAVVSGTAIISKDLTFALTYSTPGNFSAYSKLPDVSMNDLLLKLTNDEELQLPEGFNPEFRDNTIRLEKNGADYTFALVCEVTQGGTLGVQVEKTSAGKWGFALGIDLRNTPPTHSEWGLSFLQDFMDIFHLSDFLLVVATAPNMNMNFGNLQVFNNPTLKSNVVALPQGESIVRGLNVYAKWDLSTITEQDEKGKQQKLIKDLFNLEEASLSVALQVSLPNPAVSSMLAVSLSGKEFGDTGIKFKITFGGRIRNEEIGIFLQGSTTLYLPESLEAHDNKKTNPVAITIEIAFTPEAAYLSGSAIGKLPKFGPLQLANLAVMAGIDYEGIPSFGFAATLDLGGIGESSLAIMFDSGDPIHSLLAGSISDLTLADIFDKLTNVHDSAIDEVLDKVAILGTNEFFIDKKYAKQLDLEDLSEVATQTQGHFTIPSSKSNYLFIVNEKGKQWFLTTITTTPGIRHYEFRLVGNQIKVSTEAQLYIAPQATTIGAMNFPAGFFINGRIKFFELDATITLEVDYSRGFYFDTFMDPIFIKDFKPLFCIKAAKEDDDGVAVSNKGPRISLSTYRVEDAKPAEFKDPHFYVNGEIDILGLVKDAAFIKITKETGLDIDVKQQAAVGLSFELKGHYKGGTDFKMGGDVFFGFTEIDLGKLGKLKLDTGVGAKLNIQENGKSFDATLILDLMLENEEIDIPAFNLDIDQKEFSQPLKLIADILYQFFIKNPENWAKLAKIGVIFVEKEIKDILVNEFGLSPEEADNILGVAKVLCPVTSALNVL